MTQSIEQVRSRLANVEAIQPLLSALRTMSMGAWQVALKKIEHLEEYEKKYDRILFEVLPFINRDVKIGASNAHTPNEFAESIFLVIGTERGLCGKFNIQLVEKTISHINNSGASSYQIWALGSKLIREFERKGVKLSWEMALPGSGLVSYQQSYELTQSWLAKFENYNFNRLTIIFNQTNPREGFQLTTINLLPYEINRDNLNKNTEQKDNWPPVIIETDPAGIYQQIIQHFVAIRFYKTLLKSLAAEHSARYYLMEEANDNASEIVGELIQSINAERKRKITQEMQELAVGSGLLDHQ